LIYRVTVPSSSHPQAIEAITPGVFQVVAQRTHVDSSCADARLAAAARCSAASARILGSVNSNSRKPSYASGEAKSREPRSRRRQALVGMVLPPALRGTH
jgi:hypothetical protein